MSVSFFDLTQSFNRVISVPDADWDTGSISVVCCAGSGRVEHRKILSHDLLYSWIHLCVILDLEIWRYTIAIDQDMHLGNISNLSGKELVVRGGGLLLVGQEQDLHGGGFNLEQTYEGYMSELLLFPQVLRMQRIKEFLSCNLKRLETAIVTFSKLDEEWEMLGDTEKINFTEEELCGVPPPVHVMFPELRTLKETQDQCHMLKGKLSAPQSARENADIVKATETHKEICTISWGVYLWLGVRAVFSNNSWSYISLETNKTMSYTNFRSGYSMAVASYECTYMDSFNTGEWTVYPCSLKTCSVCSFAKPSTLRLRGLCVDTRLDRMFIIKGVRNGKPLFSGIGNTEIFWDNTTWVLADQLEYHITGRMQMTSLLQYPLGLRRWNITGAVWWGGDRGRSRIIERGYSHSLNFDCERGSFFRQF